MVDFSVIVPVFNSEKTLEELFLRTEKVFVGLNKTFEVIFVEDSGTDDSWKVIKDLKSKYGEKVSGIKLSKNFGQHNAVFCGLNNFNGNTIITIDDDLQVPPEEIPKLINCYNEQNPDMVYGYFKKKKHSVLRNIGSWYIKKSSKHLLKSPGEGSSFRLISRQLAEKLLKHAQEFVYIDELLLWYTDDIAFVNVDHEHRKHNKSGYSAVRLFRITFNLMIYYTALPLKMMIYGGFVSSVISFIIGLFYILKKMIFHHALPGYTSLIVAILFSTSLIIFSLGIIGEYLHRIYKVQNKKPPFSIKEKI